MWEIGVNGALITCIPYIIKVIGKVV